MLKTKHFFPFIKMIKALDIKDELKEIYQKTRGKSQEELGHIDESEGIDYLYMFVEKLPNAEKEVMDFLAIFTGRTRDEIDELGIDETFEIISQIVTDESFQSFLSRAVK